MAETPNDRLRRARKMAGFENAVDFARKYDLSEVTYRSADNGTRGLTVSAAKKYAALLREMVPWITWQWLVDGGPIPAVQLIGYVGAGAVVLPFDGEPEEWVDAPPGLVSGVAARVEGVSMLPVYRPKDLLFFDTTPTRVMELAGQDCLVQTADGRRLVKSISRSPKRADRGYAVLVSYAPETPKEDVKIISAAPVKWVKRA